MAVVWGHALPLIALADEILRTVIDVVAKGDRARPALDIFPAALYVTDAAGLITYFNPACVDFAGRRPTVGQDRWCVTWKLYTDQGDFLPHDRCPMAVAIQTHRAVRGVRAVAERPDGTRVDFMPFPTPVWGANGEFLGAVNMLVDITRRDQGALSDLCADLRAWLSGIVEAALATFTTDDIRTLLGEMDEQLAPPASRALH